MEKSLIIYHSSRIDTYGNTANENWESCDLSDNISKHSMVKVEAGNFENICATRIWICKNEYEFLMLYFEVVYQALSSAWQCNSKIIKCTKKKKKKIKHRVILCHFSHLAVKSNDCVTTPISPHLSISLSKFSKLKFDLKLILLL